VFLQASRRGEELRLRLLAEADRLAKEPAGGDRVTLADFAIVQGQQVLAANEQMVLVDKLRPVYQGLPAFAQVEKRWKQYRVNVLQNRGDRSDELIALQRELATDYPRDYNLQSQYAQALYQRGERDVFTRRLYTLKGQQTFDEIKRKYDHEPEFRAAVDRYINDFEKLLADVSRNDRDKSLTQSYLTSDTGKVYTMLAHAAGRFS